MSVAPTVLLASQSRARAEMLANAGVRFEAAAPGLDEAAHKSKLIGAGCSPCEIAQQLAVAKASSIAADPQALVIGADQTLDLDGELFDKPDDREQARQQLTRLQGRDHRLHASAVLVRGGEALWTQTGTVQLRMRRLSPAFLDDYLAREGEAILGCVGAYRFEGLGAQLFERVDGDYFSVLGLPLLGLLGALRAEGALSS